MKLRETDILISGGGVAGLTAACAFGAAGFSVICVDPAAPVTEEAAANADLRTTAFLQPARRLFETAGLWDRLAPHAAALQIMRIVDAGGASYAARDIADFNAQDISQTPFGWNLPNWLLRREMLARIGELPNVEFLPATATARLTTRSTEARISLSDGTQVRARLLPVRPYLKVHPMPKISRQFALRLADFASPMILSMISGRDAAARTSLSSLSTMEIPNGVIN